MNKIIEISNRRNKFVINKDSKILTPEAAVLTIFGISFNTLIESIIENKKGEYDFLYVKES